PTAAPRSQFTIVQAQGCPEDAPTLVAPANEAQDLASSVDFAWNPVSGAVKYLVFAEVDEGADTLLGMTTDTHLTHNMPAGDIEWWVIAVFAGCGPLESEHFGFEVARSQ